jgi:hypothetical protein
VAGVLAWIVGVAIAGGVLALLIPTLAPPRGCASPSGPGQPAAPGSSGQGRRVGATEYGGPGDPGSGTLGASGIDLLAYPDSYAELGGFSFQTATAMGGLPYMTPLRVTWRGRSAIAYKRDFGLGGPPIDGLPRVIDLWWQLAERLGIPYSGGLWSGPVTIARPPDTGAGNLLGQAPDVSLSVVRPSPDDQNPGACAPGPLAGVALTPGEHARLLAGGQAAAPADAPEAVKEMIAAGNQIVGKPYLYGAAHGLPLAEVAPAYDCSSSVEHLLYGARLVPVTYGAASGALEAFGAPGPGRWVTLYANPAHVFMYVAGLRWDTHDAAGAGDGGSGIGWHPLIRDATGFVARHPRGL